jgi:hypothetical protein
LYLCVLIVFSLHRESLKLILVMNPFPRWFCHSVSQGGELEGDRRGKASKEVTSPGKWPK